MSYVGKRLKEYLKINNLSVRKFSEISDVPRTTLQDIVNDRVNDVGETLIEKIVAGMGMTMEKFYSERVISVYRIENETGEEIEFLSVYRQLSKNGRKMIDSYARYVLCSEKNDISSE